MKKLVNLFDCLEILLKKGISKMSYWQYCCVLVCFSLSFYGATFALLECHKNNKQGRRGYKGHFWKNERVVSEKSFLLQFVCSSRFIMIAKILLCMHIIQYFYLDIQSIDFFHHSLKFHDCFLHWT